MPDPAEVLAHYEAEAKMAAKTPDSRTARILTRRDVTAMVALDTVDALAERVTNLLRQGRRIAVAPLGRS